MSDTIVVGTNSYVSVAEADAYIANRVHQDCWTTSYRYMAMIQACHMMETRVKWKGAKTDSSQTLEFPRTGLLDHYKKAVPNDEIPDLVKFVQIELTLFILENDPYLTPAGIQTINFGGLKLATNPTQATIPNKVFVPISHWGELLDTRNHRLSR